MKLGIIGKKARADQLKQLILGRFDNIQITTYNSVQDFMRETQVRRIDHDRLLILQNAFDFENLSEHVKPEEVLSSFNTYLYERFFGCRVIFITTGETVYRLFNRIFSSIYTAVVLCEKVKPSFIFTVVEWDIDRIKKTYCEDALSTAGDGEDLINETIESKPKSTSQPKKPVPPEKKKDKGGLFGLFGRGKKKKGQEVESPATEEEVPASEPAPESFEGYFDNPDSLPEEETPVSLPGFSFESGNDVGLGVRLPEDESSDAWDTEVQSGDESAFSSETSEVSPFGEPMADDDFPPEDVWDTPSGSEELFPSSGDQSSLEGWGSPSDEGVFPSSGKDSSLEGSSGDEGHSANGDDSWMDFTVRGGGISWGGAGDEDSSSLGGTSTPSVESESSDGVFADAEGDEDNWGLDTEEIDSSSESITAFEPESESPSSSEFETPSASTTIQYPEESDTPRRSEDTSWQDKTRRLTELGEKLKQENVPPIPDSVPQVFAPKIITPSVEVVSEEENLDLPDAAKLAEELEREQAERNKVVVERVIVKEVDSGRRGGSSNAPELIIVTGDRRSGVTTTAFNLAAAAGRRKKTLFVDFDLKRKGSLIFGVLDHLLQEEENVQRGLLSLKSAAMLDNVSLPFFEGGFDCIANLYDTEFDDDHLQLLQDVFIAQRLYRTVVFDCPAENLKYFPDLVQYASVVFCLEDDLGSALNSFITLDTAFPDNRHKVRLFSNLHYFLAKGGNPEMHYRNMAYIADLFDLSEKEIDWSKVPLIVPSVGGVNMYVEVLSNIS